MVDNAGSQKFKCCKGIANERATTLRRLRAVDESSERSTGSLRALLEYSAADKAAILENSPGFDSKSNDRINAEFYDTWLPDSAKANIKTQPVDDMYELSGIMSLRADLFSKAELSPYVNGSITPLSGGYILVSLYAM